MRIQVSNDKLFIKSRKHWFRAKATLQPVEGMLTLPRAEPCQLLSGARQLCLGGFPALWWNTAHGNCAPSLEASRGCTGPWGTCAHKQVWQPAKTRVYTARLSCTVWSLAGFTLTDLCAVGWDGRWAGIIFINHFITEFGVAQGWWNELLLPAVREVCVGIATTTDLIYLMCTFWKNRCSPTLIAQAH